MLQETNGKEDDDAIVAAQKQVARVQMRTGLAAGHVEEPGGRAIQARNRSGDDEDHVPDDRVLPSVGGNCNQVAEKKKIGMK